MSVTPLRFTGISTFSEDFQAILDRATRIAKLPVESMQNQQTDILKKKQLLNGLAARIQNLANAVGGLGAEAVSRGLIAGSSNTEKVSVSLISPNAAATYLVSDISSLARRASESTNTGLATIDQTPVDSDNFLELVFDGLSYGIDLTGYGNHLKGLKQAIDDKIAKHRLGLAVGLLNTGHGVAPHHLALNATRFGANTLQLWTEAGGGGTNLLTSINQGADANFKINGLDVSAPDNQISGLVPGLNLNLLGITAPGEVITIDVSSSRAPVVSAMETFVTAYNALVVELNKQIGEQAGLLSGEPLIGYSKALLREMIGYRSATGGPSLADMGIELDNAGAMSFKAETFQRLSEQQFQDALRFFGSETLGFVAFAARLDELSHPLRNDLIDHQIAQYDRTDARLQAQIIQLSERIELVRSTLWRQLQQADTLLASLQSQQKMLATSIQAIDYALYGRKDR